MKSLRSCLNALCGEAYAMVLGSLRLSCTMLSGCFLLSVHNAPGAGAALQLAKSAAVLREAPLGVMLLGLLFSILLEERSRLR